MECNQRHFNLLAICCNDYWRAWCRHQRVKRVTYMLEQYSYHKMKFNAYFKMTSVLYNICFSKLEKIILDNNIDLLIGGQQSIFIPKLTCKIIQRYTI